MIRVLFVCTVPTDNSGIPNVIFNLMENLPREEVKLGYVSINEPGLTHKNKLKSLGVEVHVIPRKIQHPIAYVKALTKISKDYDVLHAHGNSATMILEMLAAKLAGVKLRIAHSHSTTCNNKIIDHLSRTLFYKLCNGRLACGKEAGRWLFRNKDFEIVKNGISTCRFRFSKEIRNIIRTDLKIPELDNQSKTGEGILIGHIGNFVEAKNHKFLIEIFDQFHQAYPNSKLLLLGAGELLTSVKREVKKRDLEESVIFMGSVNNPEYYMNAMDVILMPSVYEGLPLSLIEEQANGLRIVASNTISVDANVTGNITYCTINNREISTWVEKSIDSLCESDVRESRSRDAIKKIKEANFDATLVGESLLKYYKSKLCLVSQN